MVLQWGRPRHAAEAVALRSFMRRRVVAADANLSFGVGRGCVMRALACGRWSWSIHQGGIHSGRPSVLMRQVQPFCRKWVWWYLQSKLRLQTLR
jgi:hypothetical protein